MQYFHVWVRSEQYRGREALTYSHSDALQPGQIVTVPLRKASVLGFVVARVSKPTFNVKPVTSVWPLPPLPTASLRLANWVSQFYASPVGVTSMQFLPAQLHPAYQPTAIGAPPEPIADSRPLTTPQQAALDIISRPDTYLLHGRTGSGKTRIYVELTRRVVAAGKSVLILSPEIGLTSQLATPFQQLFGQHVIILHSQLTAKEREIAWLTILSATKPIVVIGPRSALFSPIADLGLLVVDEAHDSAYKQEQPPYYQAVRVASQLRVITDSILVLGSATPLVSDYFVAEAKQKPIIRLDSLAISHDLAHQVEIVDLKDRAQFSRSSHLSTTLIHSITQSLSSGEQTLLYLNRRGTARVTICTMCGWQALCPNCDLPLAYHGDKFRLRCHTCGYEQAPIMSCPVCGNPSLSFRSFGTKAIVEEVQNLFPDARILRFDTDTAKADRLEQQYSTILEGNVDILVGTQMLTKGLDLPRLSTLGIIMADSSLYLPDYTAQERTYQLLTQVMGRIGRGHVASRAIVQTYYPDSSLLAAALSDDWHSFYDNEIAERKQYRFPPFCHLLKVSCSRASSVSAERTAKQFKDILLAAGLHIEVDGPAPAFHEKAGGRYHWQLVIKAQSRSQLLAVLALLPSNWSYDLDPADLL